MAGKEPTHPWSFGRAWQSLSILWEQGRQSNPLPAAALPYMLSSPKTSTGCHSPFSTRDRAGDAAPKFPTLSSKLGNLEIPSWLPEGVQGNYAFPAGKLPAAGREPSQAAPGGGMLVLTLLSAQRMADSRLFQASPAKPWMRTALQAGRVSSTAPRWASLREGCCEPKLWCFV